MTDVWYFMDGSVRRGPVTLAVLVSQRLRHDSLVWKPGMADWKRAADVPEIAARLTPQPQPQPPNRPRHQILDTTLWVVACVLVAWAVYAVTVSLEHFRRGDSWMRDLDEVDVRHEAARRRQETATNDQERREAVAEQREASDHAMWLIETAHESWDKGWLGLSYAGASVVGAGTSIWLALRRRRRRSLGSSAT